MNSHMMRALADMSKHGGNYFANIHVEGQRQKRLQEARVEAERIYGRNREDKLADVKSNREYVEGRDGIKRKQTLEDREIANEEARSRIDYQIDRNTETTIEKEERERKELESRKDIVTYYDSEGNPINFKKNDYGQLEEAEELEGLSETNPKGKAFKETDSQRRNNGYLIRMADSSNQMYKIAQEQGLDMSELNQQLTQYSDINMIKDPALRQYATNMADWVRSKLRKESGAVIGEKEAMDEIKTYFPFPGDTKADIKEKQRKRGIAEFSLGTEVHGTKYTKKQFVEDYGDPYGLFSKKKTNGRNQSQHPPDIQKILDASKE